MSDTYLPSGLPIPVAERDGLSRPYLDGLRAGRLRVQRCRTCGGWQWGPEWICHRCHAFDPDWTDVEPRGRIYSWERVWHPVSPVLANAVPYVIVLVELAVAPEVRLVGNLLGDPCEPVEIGQNVVGIFEDHVGADPPFSLLQWRRP